MEVRSWETLAALVAGTQASVCGSDAIIYSKTTSGRCRTVKVEPSAGGIGPRVVSFWGRCFAPVPSGSSPALCVRSFVTAVGDPKPLEVRSSTLISIPGGDPGADVVASLLAAVWDHSRALWLPEVPLTVAREAQLEQSLPLCTPMSRCFRIVVGLAARIARPAHSVNNCLRSPVGGSAVLKSPAFGSGATLVLNVQVDNKASVVNIVGKREGHRAVKASRPLPENIEVMPGDNGWRRKPGSHNPLQKGALEVTLYAILQALVEVIQARE